MKKQAFIIFFLLKFFLAFCFDNTIGLNEDAFKALKFYFTVTDIVDARPNKAKEIGSYTEGSEYKFIGNDTLSKELFSFLKNSPSFVGTNNKVILVLKQFNIRENKSIEERTLDFMISLDYYKVTGNTCVLSYRQYFIYRDRPGKVNQKALNKLFTKAIEFAFLDYKNQTGLYKPIPANEIALSSFYDSFKMHVDSVFNIQDLQDGIYSSYRDLFLKEPLILKDLTLPDASEIIGKSITLKFTNYIMQRTYALVKNRRIFIYIKDNKYGEVELGSDGKLYFGEYILSTVSGKARIGAMLFTLLPGYAYAKEPLKETLTTTYSCKALVNYETGDILFSRKQIGK